MGLVNTKQDDTLETLTQDLWKSIENQKYVTLQLYSHGWTMQTCVCLDDVTLDECLIIVAGNLELTIDYKQAAIFEVVKDEFEHNYYVICDDLSIDFGFMD